MSDRSDREQRLLHLVDRARRGVALEAEFDQLADGITEQAARIVTLEHVAAGNKRHVQLIVPELEQAGAAITRVRALASQWAVLRAHGSAATELRAALDQAQPPATTASTGTSGRCSCGRPDPGPCQPCPTGTRSLHCACTCTSTDTTTKETA